MAVADEDSFVPGHDKSVITRLPVAKSLGSTWQWSLGSWLKCRPTQAVSLFRVGVGRREPIGVRRPHQVNWNIGEDRRAPNGS